MRLAPRIPLLLAILLALPAAAPRAVAVDDAPLRSPRGVMGSVEISPPAPLRARPVRDAGARVLVRVVPIDDARQRIEWLGLVEGSFDLVPLLETIDGRAAGIPPLMVEVFTQLPPGSGTDLFGSGAWRLDLSGGHRALMLAIAALWIVVPVVVLVRRRLRRPAAAPVVAAPPEPTLAERLHAAVAEASTRELSPAERGRLELLLHRLLRAHAGGGTSIADATARLREDPATAPAVRAVEAWLHARTSGDRAHALAAIADAAARERAAASSSTAGARP